VSDTDLSEAEKRARAIALLEANHAFPTDYSLSVIARNDEAVQELVLAAAFEETGERPQDAHEILPSSGGKYVSHRLTIRCTDAEHVLRIYARLRAIDGILSIL
jgi:putative lipoic acid-binding regulatory protein